MKKLLPCRLLTVLLLFVAFFATGNLVAQEPGNCNIMSTVPARGCVGIVNIYSAAMNPASNGQTLLWTIPVNQTGAFFTDALVGGTNLGTSISTICHATVIDEKNNVFVNVGPNAGSLKVEMLIQGQGPVGGCNSSRTVRKVIVTGEPGKVVCHDEKGCIQFTAATQSAVGGAFIPSPPYLYTLQETGATSTDGLFCNLSPGVAYHVDAREVVVGDLNTCTATSDGVTIVNPPVKPVTLTCPDPFSKSACLYADRAAVQTEFNAWLAKITKGGGTGVITVTTVPPSPVLPDKIECGGKVTVVWNAIDECKQTATCSSTFEIVASSVATPNLPGDKDIKACDALDLAKLQIIIDAYKAEFSAGTGGCAPKVVFDDVIIPQDRCSGPINISGKITDKCATDVPFLKHLNITPPDQINYKAPADNIKPACFYKTQKELDDAYALWVQGFRIDPPFGGCNPQLNVVPGPTPKICGEIVTVIARITDVCITTREISAKFGVETPLPAEIICPAPKEVGPCITQAALDTAWNAFLAGATKKGGCDGPLTNDGLGKKPPLCGGVATVRFTYTPLCGDVQDCFVTFTVKDSPKPVITKCADGGDLKCNPEVIPGADITKIIVTSTCDYTVVPTVTDTHTDCFYKRVIKYVVSTECWKDAASCEQTYTWKQDKIAPIITIEENHDVPGGDEDTGLCSPTTTVGGPSFTPPKFNGSSNVSIDFGQVRTGDAPDELLKWTNGTTTAQSEYLEGQCVPQRVLIAGLKKGKHTLYIRHEAVKKQDASRHAYDFLTGWDNAILAAANIGTSGRSLLQNLNAQECDGNWSGAGQDACKAFTTSAKTDIPDVMGNPPNQTGNRNVNDNITCFEGEYGNRQMEMEANSAVSGFKVRFLGYDGSDSKSDYAWYAIDWDSQSTTVELKFAGRMAMGGGSCGYGNCHGAGSVHGNPYHIILEGLDGAGVGQRDNQTKCKRSQTCDVNIGVKFPTPTASDCDPVAPIVVKDGEEVITHNEDGTVTHCQKWTATDACGNVAHAEECIRVVCVLGANFGDAKGLIRTTSKTVGYVPSIDNTIESTVATPAISRFTVYPNPTHNSFSLSLDTTSSERVNLSIYDMLGKQLDQRVTTPGEINSLQLGNEYPTGIYNLILNQATEQRTVRLLKQ